MLQYWQLNSHYLLLWRQHFTVSGKKHDILRNQLQRNSQQVPFSTVNAILEIQNSMESVIDWHKTSSAIVKTLHITMFQLNFHYSEERNPMCTRVWNEDADLQYSPGLHCYVTKIRDRFATKRNELFLTMRKKQERKHVNRGISSIGCCDSTHSFKTTNIDNSVLLRLFWNPP